MAIIEHSDEVLELLVLEVGLANQERAFLKGFERSARH